MQSNDFSRHNAPLRKLLHCSLQERPLDMTICSLCLLRDAGCLSALRPRRKAAPPLSGTFNLGRSAWLPCFLPFGDSRVATSPLKSPGWSNANLWAYVCLHPRLAPACLPSCARTRKTLERAGVWATQHAEFRRSQPQSSRARGSKIKPGELRASFLISRTFIRNSPNLLALDKVLTHRLNTSTA